MQKRLISILKLGLFLGLGIFLSWWSIHKMSDKDYQDFLTAIKTANYHLVFPVILILVTSHISRAIRWRLLMKSMGYKPKLSNTFCAVMVGYLANLAVPRLGEVLKCTILSKYEKVPADKLVGTILVERAVDLLSFLIVIIIALLTQAKVFGSYANQKFHDYFLTSKKFDAIIKLGILILVFFVSFFILKIVFKKYRHITFIQKIKKIFVGVKAGLLSIKQLDNKWLFIFHSILIWACYLAGTYIGFLAMKETAGLPYFAAFPVLCFGTVAMILSPGGIGFYPIFLAEVMQLYDVQESFGKANGWLQWSAQFLIILVVGTLCSIALSIINKSKNESSTSNTR